MSFEVYVLGVGDTFSEVHSPTSFVLHYDGFHLAIDCPDMYRRVLFDANARSGRTLTLPAIDHVLITHVHGDHMNGLEGVAFFKRFAENKKLKLIASPDVRDVIWDNRLSGSMGQLWDGTHLVQKTFDDYFEYQELTWERVTAVGPFQIRTRRTLHHLPTSALLIEAGGATLGYSCDTAFDPSLLRFLEPADLIIHETNLGPSHTDYQKLVELPKQLRDKMRLVHYPDYFDAMETPIPKLVEGDVFTVVPAGVD